MAAEPNVIGTRQTGQSQVAKRGLAGVAVSQFNSEALEQCRTTVSSQASQFGAIGDGFPNQCGNPSIFGKLGSSGGLSSAVDRFTALVGEEFAAAESLMGKVERALDAVQQSVRQAEDAAVHAMTPAS
ncbi:hypothetical protein LX15_005832 [Streptoalloteichus tenebrarius]|uniref:Uncharacterized protein n=1 Tax=Streptoalloteichus tenebrarius (strain ATCC 17920 / DSM 40477 / JCM 4838 / CBS 697.72 / NBRC 16177 / NCIMB 11028 / NRRL B-12390 / A12253. 1 / ISP 5477) TaxID=1933 RepID=A0ABT1I3E7_STRSD|nr:hypothetical protein [Streptoalloteichus tenebrarius]